MRFSGVQSLQILPIPEASDLFIPSIFFNLLISSSDSQFQVFFWGEHAGPLWDTANPPLPPVTSRVKSILSFFHF